ncbi:facilitated trehalose transporter Tret1-2 homolog isoform X2 [Eriocheir sinensis]|nr:facilitated trehalose transporter Tret1-2 homolog isoform X2 [Eriocheir sinensis]
MNAMRLNVDDGLPHPASRRGSKASDEAGPSMSEEMTEDIFSEDISSSKHVHIEDIIGVIPLEVFPSTSGYDNPAYDMMGDDDQSKSSPPSHQLPTASPLVIPPLQPVNSSSLCLEFVIMAAALSQISIGATVTWPHVLRSHLASNSTNFYNTEMHLSSNQLNLANYLLLAGVVAGLAPSGWMVAGLGRSISLIVAALAGISSWALNALAPSATVLLVERFLAGFTATMLKVSVTTYVMEVSVVSDRGLVLAYLQVMEVLGSLLCLTLNHWLHWTYIGFAYLGLLVLVCSAFLFFPESPVYLLMQRKEEKARGVLHRLRAKDTDVEVELQWIKRYDTKEKRQSEFLSLFKRPLIDYTVTLVGLAVLAVSSGSAIITSSMKRMLLAPRPIMSGKTAMMTMVGALGAGKLVLAHLTDRMGRRLCLLLSLMLLVLAYSVVGAMDYASASYLNVDPLTSTREATDAMQVNQYSLMVPMSWAVVRACFLVLSVVSLGLGLDTVPTMLAVEYFPAHFRPQGLSVFLIASSLLQAFSMFLQSLMDETLTMPGLFWTLAAFALLGIFYTNLGVYEINSRTLKAPDLLQCFFRENFYEPRPIT